MAPFASATICAAVLLDVSLMRILLSCSILYPIVLRWRTRLTKEVLAPKGASEGGWEGGGVASIGYPLASHAILNAF